jgi:hypothetical protein
MVISFHSCFARAKTVSANRRGDTACGRNAPETVESFRGSRFSSHRAWPRAVHGDGPASGDDEPARDEPTIVCTSLVGAKGLSAAYVFIVGFANSHFPRHPCAISDNEIGQFLVGLSRTHKACHVVSCRSLGQTELGVSAFADWIEPHLEERTINAAYFKG